MTRSVSHHYLMTVGALLLALALVAGMTGCGPIPGPSVDLEIRTWYDLNAVRDNLDGYCVLMNDLDSATPGYEELASPRANEGKGWEPIGTRDDPFVGTFDGKGYEIGDLYINRPEEEKVGLIGSVSGIIRNIGLVNADVTGRLYVGGLVGHNHYGQVSDSYSSGSVTGDSSVGCLVGLNGGTVSNSYATRSVTGISGVGGLVGVNDGPGGLPGQPAAKVVGSYSVGVVTGDDSVGGLVGLNRGLVVDSYSSGAVTGSRYVGGLVGRNFIWSKATGSHSTGNVKGDEDVGGLVGYNYHGTVSDSHATGSATGVSSVGGLVGRNSGAVVSNSYSRGSVIGGESIGGLIGVNVRAEISNAHYNYHEVLLNEQSVITVGAMFGEDFEEWLANGMFLDVDERLLQEDGYYQIDGLADFKQLLVFGQDPALKFRLTEDLDLSEHSNLYIPYFAGEFDGNGHEISNLSFGFGFVSNVGLLGHLARDGKVTGLSVANVDIIGHVYVGGLVGQNRGGAVDSSLAAGNVTGTEYVGGLVGANIGVSSTVTNSCAIASVTGDVHVGGLVGHNLEAYVRESHSSGTVVGRSNVGGLAGHSAFSTIRSSYSTGSVAGDEYVGGLVGQIRYRRIVDSYSTGSVTGDEYVGGLVGFNDRGAVTDSFWDVEVSEIGVSDGGTGRTTAEMMSIATFRFTSTEGLDEPWDIIAVQPEETNPDYTWNIVDGETYPFLSWQSVVNATFFRLAHYSSRG